MSGKSKKTINSRKMGAIFIVGVGAAWKKHCLGRKFGNLRLSTARVAEGCQRWWFFIRLKTLSLRG